VNSEEFMRQFIKGVKAGNPPWGEARDFCKQDSPDGFQVFCELIRNRTMPRHVRKWAGELYDAKEEGDFFGNEAFRGATKTTALTEALTA